MKFKKFLLCFIILLVVFLNIISNIKYKEKTKLKNTNNMVSILLEDNDGKYIRSSDRLWPESGYIFNKNKSYCQKGSKLTWDNKTKKIKVNIKGSDKCYVYFDKRKSNIDILNENNNNNSLTEKLVGDMYRFYSKDANNYICFGTSEKCLVESDYMYRIIGVTLDNELKLMKNTSIGTYQYNSEFITDFCGEEGENCIWENSDLLKKLNGEYFLNNINYSYLQDTSWLSLIQDKYWNVGLTTDSGNGKDILTSEQKALTLNSWKIAIVSLSDITMAYNGTETINCDRRNCLSWLPDSGFWTINYAGLWDDSWHYRGFHAWIWNNNSSDAIGVDALNKNHEVYPVFYLKDRTVIKGEGTSINPYIIDLENSL